MSTTSIRPEAAGDAAAVRAINERAFGRPDDADLVDALRARSGGGSFSLVAEHRGRVVGDALWSPVEIRAGRAERPALPVGGAGGDAHGRGASRRGAR